MKEQNNNSEEPSSFSKEMKEGAFKCPECESEEASICSMVSTEPDESDPWSMVLKRLDCAKCKRTIPAHLAERWDMSYASACKEWVDVYRDIPS